MATSEEKKKAEVDEEDRAGSEEGTGEREKNLGERRRPTKSEKDRITIGETIIVGLAEAVEAPRLTGFVEQLLRTLLPGV